MEFNQSKADAFANRLFGALNEGALCLMTSIGHRTGLFDTMAELPPSTSGEIARKAGLNERYVREWLGAMTTGRVVDYDAATGAYSLPPEHAAFLSRKGTPNNVAVFAQYIRCSVRWKTRSSTVSSAAAGSLTRSTSASIGSWLRTVGKRCSRRCSTTSFRLSRP